MDLLDRAVAVLDILMALFLVYAAYFAFKRFTWKPYCPEEPDSSGE